MKGLRFYLFILAMIFVPCALCAQNDNNAEVESIDMPITDSLVKKTNNPITWIMEYLNRTNKPNDKKFDVSFILGPSYNITTQFGIGALAAGLYSWDVNDSSLPKSNVTLFGNASTTGMLAIGLRGNNFLPKRRYRIDYTFSLSNTPADFWGIGYENGNNDDLVSQYRRITLQFKPEFLFRITDRFYVGPALNLSYTNSYQFTNNGERLLEGQAMSIPSSGAGLDLVYDSRDVVINAYKGSYLQLSQLFYPRFMGNKNYSFSSTEFTASKYLSVWKGGVIAGEIHAQCNYGNVPWTMMAAVGTNNRMRGYYLWRYRDNNVIEGQLELRQRIHGRYGAVVWIGVANVFPNFSSLNLQKSLPNYGVGYRWEFKERMNIRFDLGFTNKKPTFMFNINEAF